MVDGASPRAAHRRGEPRREADKIYGINAANAVAMARPEAIVRVLFARSVRELVAPLIRVCTGRRLPCHEVSEQELTRFSTSVHHEGVCIEARPRSYLPVAQFASWLAARHGLAFLLDRVSNPHNLGAILRSAAFFGVDALAWSDEDGQSKLTPAATRIAEGGAEHVGLVRVPPPLPRMLALLRAQGVWIVGADAHADRSVERAKLRGPCVLVMGNEREGLAPDVRAACNETVAIAGAGRVESLNVSVAAGVLLAEAVRQRRAR